MTIDTEKVDEAVLELIYLIPHDEARAWKSFDCGRLSTGCMPRASFPIRFARPNPSS
jgi:hypothetical protein